MKLGFFLTLWLCHIQFLLLTDASENVEADIEKRFDAIVEDMLSSLKKSIALPLDRQKRELGLVKPSLVDDSGVYRLVSVKPVTNLCQPAIRTLFLDVSNLTYAVCLSALERDGSSEVTVGYYREHTWTPFHRWLVNKADDVAAFYFRGFLYVLVTDSEKVSGTELVKINLETYERIVDHDVTSYYATSLAVWKMKITGQYNLAIANSGSFDNGGYSSQVFTYEWKGTYFDKYASFNAYDVKDIEPFHIHGAAYLAVANFQRSRNNYEVDSEILRYDQDGKMWISHQKIKSYGAMDWEFFALGDSLGQEFFLALANKGSVYSQWEDLASLSEKDGRCDHWHCISCNFDDSNVQSMIYKFVEDKFVPFQCLPTSRAVSLASYSVDGIFLLAVANEYDAVHLYQYDGWRFVVTAVQSTQGALSDGVVHLKFHRGTENMDKALILSVSNPVHYMYPSVFEIGFAYENPLGEWNQKANDWCLNTLQKLESADISKTFDFSDVIFIDQPTVHIDGDLIFENGFSTNTLKTPKFTEISTQEVFDDNLLQQLANLHSRLEAVRQKLETFSNILSNSLKVDGNQTIKSNLQFQDAVFTCGNGDCHFENIHTEVLNDEGISDWSSNLVFMDSEQFVNGTIMAKGINALNMHVFGEVDGVKSENLVTKTGAHSIKAHKTFESLIQVQDLQVSGKLDGVTVSPNTVLLSTGHQKVTGKISFENVNTTWLRTKYVNGKDLTAFLNDLVLTDKSAEILGTKTFSDVTVNELLMTPGSTINGVDFIDLWKNTLWTDGIQSVSADMTFSDVMFEKNLFVTAGINGIQIPGPRIVDITEPTVILASQTFKNSTKMRNLQVLESLNGMPLLSNPDGSKQLDIMLKTGDQVITGGKTFQTIHLDADSDVKGYVDGVDLSEFQSSVLRKDNSVITNGTWTFQNLIIKGPLTVQGKFSGVNLKDVFDRALRLDEPSIPEMIFRENVFAEELFSGDINGINVTNDLVLKNEPQTIFDEKIFDSMVLQDGSVMGLINNMDFSFLDEILIVIGNQRIKSQVFKKNVKINNLIVRNSINGIPIEDIVTLKGGKIYGSRSLSNVSFSTIEAKNVEVTGKVNNIVLEQMMKDTMTYDGNEEVLGKKTVKGTLVISDGADLETTDLNGVNLRALWDDAVFIDIPAVINGVVTFEDNVVFDALSFNKTIDGVSEFEMRHNWMLKDKPQEVKGNVKFMNGFSAKDLTVQTVNGIDLKTLQSEIVKTNEATEIRGPIIFENTVVSLGNVSLTGKIQGVDLSEEAVDRNNLIVTGTKTFHQDLAIEGDLTIDGLLNGIDIKDLCNNTFLKSKDVSMSRLVIKGNLVLNDGVVGGNLAGVDMSLLNNIALPKDGSDIEIQGEKIFENITFEGPVTLKGKLGGVFLNELEENYMSLTKDQDIPAKMSFDELSFSGILSADNFDVDNKEINGVNIERLNNMILRTSKTQNVTATYYIDEVHFLNDLFVAGYVNGLELPRGVMRHNHINYIESPKFFEQTVTVYGNLDMERGKKIQNVDVSDWFQKAVLKQGKFEINGYKVFNRLTLNDVKVEGRFDNLEISENSLLMTYGDQIIKGRKEINGSVNIEGSLTVAGLINMVNITELANSTLQRDKNNTVSGLKYFQQPLTVLSLQASTVAGVDIQALKEKLDTSLDVNELENKLEEIEIVVAHMKNAFDNQAVLFQYYELFAEFGISSAYDWLYVSGDDCGELLLLSVNSTLNTPCTSVRIFGFDKTSKSFIPARQALISSYAVSVKSLILDETYIFVANGKKNDPCTGNSELGVTTVDVYSWNVDSFRKVQSVPTNGPLDMAAFKNADIPCFVVLELDGSRVYCFAEKQNFTISETLFTTGGQKVSVVQSQDETILAIAAEDVSGVNHNYVEGQRTIDIYVMESTAMEFGPPKQFISSTFTQSLALVKHADMYSEVVFLVTAEGSIPKIHNKPKIVVYRYDVSLKTFEKFQEINDFGTLEWLALKTGELLLFVMDSRSGQVKVYQYKGASGFVKVDAIKAIGTIKVHPFIRSDPEDWMNHYLALAGPYATMAQPTQGGSYAKILKSKVKGKRPIY